MRKEMPLNECYRTHLIDGAGVFDENATKRFCKDAGVVDCGNHYAVVSVIGPQSTGKSTLLNHLFQTNFTEMNILKRCRTTQGVWIARCIDIEPCTIAVDLEGIDGTERAGTGDLMFESHITLFAFAISDILLINVWHTHIGLVRGSSLSHLKRVFEVMMRVIKPRKTTLLFVIRDHSKKTSLERLESSLREDVNKMWDDVVKSSHHNGTPLNEYFTMEFTTLANYESYEEEFKTQVAQLRGRISEYISLEGIASAGRGSIPASKFFASAQIIWKTIRENKDLNLPKHEVMVANVLCRDIANEKFSRWRSDQGWLALKEDAEAGAVVGFGKTIGSLLDVYLSEYDEEVQYLHEGVRNSERHTLESKALQDVYPAFKKILKHLHRILLAEFKHSLELSRRDKFAYSVSIHSKSSMDQFDEGCADAKVKQANWNPSKVRNKLHDDLKRHTTHVRDAKLNEFNENYERLLRETLLATVDWLFEFSKENTWVSIRLRLHHETQRAISSFSMDVKGFDLPREIYDNTCVDISNFAKHLVKVKASEESKDASSRIQKRFSSTFNYDDESVPRFWTAKEDIRAITKEARSASLKLLSVLAAIRIDDISDTVEQMSLSSLLYDGSDDLLASTTWETVPIEYTLITPLECLGIWKDFLTGTENIITMARVAQDAYKRSWSPWAILDMSVNWFNELMLLPGWMTFKTTVRNSFKVFLIIVLFSVCIWLLVTQWEYLNSALAEFVSKSSTVMSMVVNMMKRLFNGDQNLPP